MQRQTENPIDNWFIPLTATGSWRIVPHPMGFGYALAVDRGIPCEDHVHVVTSHESGIEQMERAMQLAVEAKGDKINEAIRGFCTMSNALCGIGSTAGEAIAAAFMQALLEQLVEDARKADIALKR